jgi:hypothetical protein
MVQNLQVAKDNVVNVHACTSDFLATCACRISPSSRNMHLHLGFLRWPHYIDGVLAPEHPCLLKASTSCLYKLVVCCLVHHRLFPLLASALPIVHIIPSSSLPIACKCPLPAVACAAVPGLCYTEATSTSWLPGLSKCGPVHYSRLFGCGRAC